MEAKITKYTVKQMPWKSTVVTRKRKVCRKGNTSYYQTEIAQKAHREYVGDFEITLDIPAIIDMIVGRAMSNSTGKARMLGGQVTVKTNGKRMVTERVEEIPVREGYEEIK
jgi:hypothetical protein